jgi:hypothetical protein
MRIFNNKLVIVGWAFESAVKRVVIVISSDRYGLNRLGQSKSLKFPSSKFYHLLLVTSLYGRKR